MLVSNYFVNSFYSEWSELSEPAPRMVSHENLGTVQQTTFLNIKGSQHWKWSEKLKNLRISPFGKGYKFLPQYRFQTDRYGCTGSLKSKVKSWIFRQVYSGCYYFQYLTGMVRTASGFCHGMANLYFWILAGEGHKHRFLIIAKKRFSTVGQLSNFCTYCWTTLISLRFPPTSSYTLFCCCQKALICVQIWCKMQHTTFL